MAQGEGTKQRQGGAVTSHEAQWRERVESWRKSGLSQVAFCRREGFLAGTFGWWKRELAKRDRRRGEVGASGTRLVEASKEPVRWVPVKVPGSARDVEGLGAGEFELVLRGDRRVRLSADFDAAGLRRLVTVVESLPC